MMRLPMILWALVGLVLLHSCCALQIRGLQDNTTSVFVPGLFDTLNFEWGEEIYEFTASLINDHTDGWHDNVLNDGTTLEWSVSDAACDATIAARQYWDIRTRNGGKKPHGVVGCRCSSASIAVATIAGLEEVPQVSPSSTSDKLSDTEKYPFFSRVISSEESFALVSLFRAFGWSRVTILTTDTSYGKDQANKFRSLWLGRHNDTSGMWEGEIPYSHTILLNPNGTVNEASVHQALAGVPVDDPTINSRIILLIAHDHHAYPILKIASDSDFQPDTIWVGTEAWVDRLPTGEWAPQIPGLIGLSPFRNRDSYYQDYLSRLQHWQAQRGQTPWEKLPDYAAEYLVDSILSIAMALSNTPRHLRLDGTRVTSELQRLVFDGISGRVAFTENGDRLDPRFTIFNLKQDDETGSMSWIDVGVAATHVGNTYLSDQVCFAQVGCGFTTTTAPSDTYPLPEESPSLLLIVVIPIILLLLLAVTCLYFRTQQKKRRLKESMTEMQKKMEAMKKIDGELDDIGQQVENAKRRQNSLILQRAQLQGMPDYWTETSDTIVEVSPNDEQYWEVLDLLQETMDDVHISKLWRCQNTSLWSYYSFHKDRLTNLGCGDGERRVWHGTSSLDPSVIYDDKQDGFMMQFASAGFWGRGLYFADKAAYSSYYSFKPPNDSLMTSLSSGSSSRPGGKGDEREMFLTKLLVGNEVFLDRDVSSQKAQEYKQLTVPPTDPKTGLKYNTVTGNTGGSQVWVVYENGRAYPDYLVRYYRGARDKKRTPYSKRPRSSNQAVEVPADIEMGIKPFPASSTSSTSTSDVANGVCWEYLDNNGWKPYIAAHQALIEKHYQQFVNKKTKSSKVKLSSDEWTYEVDVDRLFQTNVDHPGHKKRAIRRQPVV